MISALRISVLSSMDFADITYTIPQANIFSGIEPCLAVILASVPMMRPLLGRNASPNPSGATPMYSDSNPHSHSHSRGKSNPSNSRSGAGQRGKGQRTSRASDGFQPLDDDTSQLWLRPMEGKHYAGISVRRSLSPGDDESDSQVQSRSQSESHSQSEESLGHKGRGRGIRVRQEWDVRESGR